MTLAGRSWADVRAELFGEPYYVWHDGPEFSGLRDAWRREPEALLDQLFAGMAEGDALASQALAELEPEPVGEVRERVIDTLERHVNASPPGARVQLGMTLYRLTGDPAWTEPIREVLDGASHWGDRIDAAMVLRRVEPSATLRAALLRNVQDDEYLVRYHSATTLLRWSGSTGDIDSDDELFPKLVRDGDPAAWAEVAAALAKREN